MAAEYTLMSLISAVHSRQSGIPLGHICINLNNKTQDKRFAKSASALLALTQTITPATLALPITVKSLQEDYEFISRKDYGTNILS